ncbi:YezD family protein [Thermoclostridium stercorarium]
MHQTQFYFNTLRRLGYGEITIRVQDGLPVMIEKATEKVKL